MNCPKCEFERADDATECPRCGVIFAKWEESLQFPATVISPRSRSVAVADDVVRNGTVGRRELLILGGGLAAAVVIYLFPLTRFIFSALVTLFHELGHAVAGWLLGYPSLPAFDFVYGGGFTHMGEFKLPIAIAVAAAFLFLAWVFRSNRKTLVVIGAVFALWIFVVSAEWRRELVIASAGHAGEFILAGAFFYQALAGVGLRSPDLERPLAAFAAFFVQIHSMAFAHRLQTDASFLAWCREGKGGALMNDLEVVALDLNIYLGLNPGITKVAGFLLLFSFLPITICLAWYFYRARWHRMLGSLLTTDGSAATV
jgi:hypothetical protein